MTMSCASAGRGLRRASVTSLATSLPSAAPRTRASAADARRAGRQRPDPLSAARVAERVDDRVGSDLEIPANGERGRRVLEQQLRIARRDDDLPVRLPERAIGGRPAGRGDATLGRGRAALRSGRYRNPKAAHADSRCRNGHQAASVEGGRAGRISGLGIPFASAGFLSAQSVRSTPASASARACVDESWLPAMVGSVADKAEKPTTSPRGSAAPPGPWASRGRARPDAVPSIASWSSSACRRLGR